MTIREFQNAESVRRTRCRESFLQTEQCLFRSRSCLNTSYTLLARNPRTTTQVVARNHPSFEELLEQANATGPEVAAALARYQEAVRDLRDFYASRKSSSGSKGLHFQKS